MSGDRPKNKRIDALQAELNRQALVDIGKRLAELEKKLWDLERDAKDVKYFSQNTLDTAKRLQGIAAKILKDKRAKKPSQP
jgi:hypothetical protein